MRKIFIPFWWADPFVEDWFEDFKTDVCFTTLAWSWETPFIFCAGIDFFTGSNVDWSPIKKLIDEFMSDENMLSSKK